MNRVLRITLPVAGLVLAGGLTWIATSGSLNGWLPRPSQEPERMAATPPASEAAPRRAGGDTTAPGAPSQATPGARDAMKIEVARVDAEGASVFAGRAPAGSVVVLSANGKDIATATASEAGQWSAVVTQPFAPGPVDLGIRAAGGVAGTEVRGSIQRVEVPKGTGLPQLATAAPRPAAGTPAPKPKSELETFADLVAAARAERERAEAAKRSLPGVASTQVPGPPVGTPELQAVGPGRVPPAGGAGNAPAPSRTVMEASTSAPATRALDKAVPVPVTFITGESEMTPDGRRAADLLVEYLKITDPPSIRLSGHADERGSDEYNLELSRKRLEAIEEHLRRNGFRGRMSLIALGKAEPFKGIDRSRISRVEAWQADRRVELILSE